MDNEDDNKEYKEESNIKKNYIEVDYIKEAMNSVCKIIVSKDNNKETETGTGFFFGPF